VGLAAAVAIGFLTVSQFRTERHTAETAIGAFQKFDLPDGSVAQLNTNSAIDVDFTVNQRRVHIARGEVFFNVTKDPARPFIVTSGPVAVRAVGTAFNVHQLGSAVEILVTEGRVRVDDAHEARSLLPTSAETTEPPMLVAGERAIVPVPATAFSARPDTASIGKIDLPASRRALAWQERRLEFDSVPLAEVVREFNRYNRQQLMIGEPSLAARHFSGTFRSDGVESLVRLLETDFGVAATRSEREIVLLLRR
jgi:transmembrane sensor